MTFLLMIWMGIIGLNEISFLRTCRIMSGTPKGIGTYARGDRFVGGGVVGLLS